MTRQARYKKRQRRADSSAQKTTSRAARSGLQSELLALQRSAGNKVVSQLLQENADDEKHRTNVAQLFVDSALSNNGQPLDSASRSHMEALFEEDFSQVRIHTDAEAADSASVVNAAAYTSGEDVVFGDNQYRPNTREGSQLLAHELAHTVQQGDHGTSPAAGDRSAATIMRAPLPGTTEPEPISLLGAKIPAPVVSRMGDAIVATVYFGQNNFLLDSRNLAAVDKLSDELRFMLNPAIAVDGYASTEGTEANNLKLSENRRTTVVALLRSKLTGTASFSGTAQGASVLAVEETAAKGPELESQKALNRRVTIVILPTTSAKPAPEEKKKPIKLFPEFEFKPETDKERLDRQLKEAIKEAEEKKRKGDEKKPGGQSLNEKIWEAVDKVVDDTAKKLGVPEKLRPYLKDGARALIEKGSEAALDEVLKQTPLNENEKEGLKKAIEAAAKTKPQ